MDIKTAKLTQIGTEWKNYGKHRVYFDTKNEKLLSVLGVRYSKYNTGNICSATLDGDHLSNSKCRKLLSLVDSVYYNVESGKIESRDYDRSADFYSLISDRITEYANAA